MMPSLTPGIVRSYDAARRICRVEIPGITDGCEVFPEAEIMQALGDKSEHTEIRILVGDRVWLAFINGDPKYPIIMGFRAKHAGNEVGHRRWHHANIETDADTDQMHTAGRDYGIDAERDFAAVATRHINIEAGSNVVIQAGADCNLTVQGNLNANVSGNVTLAVIGNIISSAASWVHTGAMTVVGLFTASGLTMTGAGGGTASITGDVDINGSLTNNGKAVGSTHTHNENGYGGGVTDPPN